jgi:hypothetical protein
MRRWSLAVLAVVGLTLGACASASPVAPVNDVRIIERIAASELPSVKVGVFAPGPRLRTDASINSRPLDATPPGGFAGYLKTSLTAELEAAGKLDVASDLEVTGFLVEADLKSSSTTVAHAALAARFVLKRDGAVVYDKVLRVTDVWKSTIVSEAAVPRALSHAYALHGKLARTLLQDPAFIAAAKG